ncbi:MAG: hypothetical protein SFU91_01760 [Chloroherpetonaceae bacterium]|nr:hypothetical protein [Chloroherpetonaceae bacterium]
MNKIFGIKEFEIDKILSRLEKGERLGIDETSYFLNKASKLLGKEANRKLFEAAKKITSQNPSLASFPFQSDTLLVINPAKKAEDIFNSINSVRLKNSTPFIRLNLTPFDILVVTKREKIKVIDFCRSLSESGAGAISGRLEPKYQNEFQLDEFFSVIMLCQKFGIQSSVHLPLSFSDIDKIHHLAKVREFADRTKNISFLVLYIDKKISTSKFLKAVALTRLMLDNLKYISISDTGLDQEKLLSKDVLEEAVKLGLNLI